MPIDLARDINTFHNVLCRSYQHVEGKSRRNIFLWYVTSVISQQWYYLVLLVLAADSDLSFHLVSALAFITYDIVLSFDQEVNFGSYTNPN